MFYAIDHPLLKDKLTVLRDKNTGTRDFRALANEITMLIAYEALKHIEIEDRTVETPLALHKGKAVKNDVILVPILRAGVGMLEGVLNLIPTAKVAFVGMYRDPETKKTRLLLRKIPRYSEKPHCVHY